MLKARLLFVAVVAIGATLSIGLAAAEDASPIPAPRAKVLALIQQLQGSDKELQQSALDTLLQMVPMTPEELDALAQAMKNPDATVRQYAVQVLADSGPDSIPALTSAIDDSDKQVRGRALNALGEMAGRRGYYSDEERSEHSNVAGAVSTAPTIWAVLIRGFKDDHEDVRQQAPFYFFREETAAVPMLRDALRDGDPNVRSGAARALRQIGPGAKDAAGDLVVALKDPDHNVRYQAAATLVDVDPARKEVLPILIERVEDTKSSQNDRCMAIELLARMKSNAQDAVPALAHLLATEKAKTSSLGVPNFTLHWWIIDALGSIGGANAAPVLGQVLTGELVPEIEPSQHPRTFVRPIDRLPPGLARRLPPGFGLGHPANIGPVAAPSVTRLKPQDPQAELRRWAATMIGKLGPNGAAALPALERAVESDKDASVRLAAVRAIGQIGAGAAPAVPTLAKALSSEQDPSVRGMAAVSIGELGAVGAPALPALEDAAKSDNVNLRFVSICAIGELGSSAAPAIPVLVAAMANDDTEIMPEPFFLAAGCVGRNASAALGKIGPPAIAALVAALKNSDAKIRDGAATALAMITSLPAYAVAALTVAVKDKDPKVREDAAQALDSLGGPEKVAADAELDREDKANAAAAAAEVARQYTEKEIEAPVETEIDGEKFKMEFAESMPVKSLGDTTGPAEFLVTLHRGTTEIDRYSGFPEQLAIWKRTGDDKYQQLYCDDPEAMMTGTQYGESSHFTAKVLVTGKGKDHYETGLFVDVPWTGSGWAKGDEVFALEPAPFGEVEIQQADEWYASTYASKLRDGESVRTGVKNSFGQDGLKFKFDISGYGDRTAHDASAGTVTGTYKIIKEMHYDEQKKEWTATWKMVPDTAQRVPYQETEYHPVSNGLVYPAGIQGPRLGSFVATVPGPSGTSNSSK